MFLSDQRIASGTLVANDTLYYSAGHTLLHILPVLLAKPWELDNHQSNELYSLGNDYNHRSLVRFCIQRIHWNYSDLLLEKMVKNTLIIKRKI